MIETVAMWILSFGGCAMGRTDDYRLTIIGCTCFLAGCLFYATMHVLAAIRHREKASNDA